MAALKYSLLYIVVLTSCATAESYKVDIENSLSKCILIESSKLNLEEEIPSISLYYKTISQTGACGCKSALNSYSSYLNIDGNKSFLLTSKFTFIGSTSVNIPLSAQRKVLGNYSTFNLVIDCATED